MADRGDYLRQLQDQLTAWSQWAKQLEEQALASAAQMRGDAQVTYQHRAKQVGQLIEQGREQFNRVSASTEEAWHEVGTSAEQAWPKTCATAAASVTSSAATNTVGAPACSSSACKACSTSSRRAVSARR